MAKAQARRKLPKQRRPPQFPKPPNTPGIKGMIFVDDVRSLVLYNAHNTKQARNISPSVQQWFRVKSVAHGWRGAKFPFRHPSRTKIAGVLLIFP